MKHTIRILCIAALGALSLEAQAASVLEVDSVPTLIGGVIGVAPDYMGSDDTKGAIAPYARYTFQGTQQYLQLSATELTLNVVNSTKYRIGPVLNYHLGRDDDVDDALVSRMREIKGTVEAGIFGEIAWIESGNPRNRFILGATMLWDAGGESDGFRARVNARYWHQASRAIDLHIGAGLVYGDSSYNDTYFGVNAANVGTSGLPFFSAGSGVHEYFLTLGAIVYFSKEWVGAAGVRLSRINGDAKDSPVVAQRGDSTQTIGGIGLAYMWR